jgi:hypothetical protein
MGWGVMNGLYLPQDNSHWRALMKTVISVLLNVGYFLRSYATGSLPVSSWLLVIYKDPTLLNR